jgi:hypothetical protein
MNSSGKTFDPVHGRYNSDIRTIEMGGQGCDAFGSSIWEKIIITEN